MSLKRFRENKEDGNYILHKENKPLGQPKKKSKTIHEFHAYNNIVDNTNLYKKREQIRDDNGNLLKNKIKQQDNAYSAGGTIYKEVSKNAQKCGKRNLAPRCPNITACVKQVRTFRENHKKDFGKDPVNLNSTYVIHSRFERAETLKPGWAASCDERKLKSGDAHKEAKSIIMMFDCGTKMQKNLAANQKARDLKQSAAMAVRKAMEHFEKMQRQMHSTVTYGHFENLDSLTTGLTTSLATGLATDLVAAQNETPNQFISLKTLEFEKSDQASNLSKTTQSIVAVTNANKEIEKIKTIPTTEDSLKNIAQKGSDLNDIFGAAFTCMSDSDSDSKSHSDSDSDSDSDCYSTVTPGFNKIRPAFGANRSLDADKGWNHYPSLSNEFASLTSLAEPSVSAQPSTKNTRLTTHLPVLASRIEDANAKKNITHTQFHHKYVIEKGVAYYRPQHPVLWNEINLCKENKIGCLDKAISLRDLSKIFEELHIKAPDSGKKSVYLAGLSTYLSYCTCQ